MTVKFDLRTTPDDAEDTVSYDKNLMIILVTFLSIILTVILVGNATVIKRLIHRKRTSRMNSYLLMLAIADFLVGIILVIPDILEKLKVTYHFGRLFCKIQYVVSVAVSSNAAYVLVCVSIDRLVAITRPMFVEHKRLRYSLLGTSWALSFINGIPMILFRTTLPMRIKTEENNVTRIQDIVICAIDITGVRAQCLVVFYAVMIFFLPLSVMIVCHAIIINELRTKNIGPQNHHHKFKRFLRRSRDNHRLKSLNVYSARTIELLAKAKVKSVKMTLVIISAYVACWSPFFVFNLLTTFNVVKRGGGAVIFIHSLGYLNSACNPLIFWMFVNTKRPQGSGVSTRADLASQTAMN